MCFAFLFYKLPFFLLIFHLSHSLEFFAWYVVHRQVVHIDSDKFECFIFDHLKSLWVKHLLQLSELTTLDSFPILGHLECLLKNQLDISQTLDRLAHAQTEVTEPLVVQSDCPVFTEELDDIWYDTILIP